MRTGEEQTNSNRGRVQNLDSVSTTSSMRSPVPSSTCGGAVSSRNSTISTAKSDDELSPRSSDEFDETIDVEKWVRSAPAELYYSRQEDG